MFIHNRNELNARHIALHLLTAAVILLAIALIGGQAPSTQSIAAVFVFAFVWSRSGRSFLRDFGLFLALLVAYKYTRNRADDLAPGAINVTNLIAWEKTLFGGALPNYVVQHHLWGQWYTPALDVIFNFFYLSHFFSPLVLAVALWVYRQSAFWPYMWGLVVLSYATFFTYVLFPAAPPWWATRSGYLTDQPVYLTHFILDADRVARSANPVAAMPSLHAGYPTFIALVTLHTWGKRAWPIVFLPMLVIFATVYLGHHYVIDALAGAGYALIVFLTVYLGVLRFLASPRRQSAIHVRKFKEASPDVHSR